MLTTPVHGAQPGWSSLLSGPLWTPLGEKLGSSGITFSPHPRHFSGARDWQWFHFIQDTERQGHASTVSKQRCFQPKMLRVTYFLRDTDAPWLIKNKIPIASQKKEGCDVVTSVGFNVFARLGLPSRSWNSSSFKPCLMYSSRVVLKQVLPIFDRFFPEYFRGQFLLLL